MLACTRCLPLVVLLATVSVAGAAPRAGLRAIEVTTRLDAPVHVTTPGGDSRLFVVEQAGRIRIVRDGRVVALPFLDLSGRVSYGGERGLLGLAFHPRYRENGYFFVHYTDRGGDSRIERFRVSRDPDRADSSSGRLVLAIDQPFSNHNGGSLAFGPDGRLWIGMGDGGAGGDPLGHARNPRSLLGKMLRLDVDGAAPYTIPADNPYRDGRGARPEIWARGLRNPWRFSFDRASGMLWIADVGQNREEEINAVDPQRGGLDFGWNQREGLRAFGLPLPKPPGLTDPVHTYGRDLGCSITGGVVYRGRGIPALRGHYLYSDYCQGWLRSVRLEGGRVAESVHWDVRGLGSVSAFGEDAEGEVYILDHGGRLLRLAAAE